MTLPAPSTVAATVSKRGLRPVRRELRPFLREDVERGDSLWHVLLSLVAGVVAFALLVVAVVVAAVPLVLYVAVYAVVAGVLRAVGALRDRR